mmetsp:Transcript_92253/g.214296  ORF Transcript_92253/g.214296 Transcript_92253/m.214296 type:complete len:212 (+) Transcript_92253:3-638(+)
MRKRCTLWQVVANVLLWRQQHAQLPLVSSHLTPMGSQCGYCGFALQPRLGQRHQCGIAPAALLCRPQLLTHTLEDQCICVLPVSRGHTSHNAPAGCRKLGRELWVRCVLRRDCTVHDVHLDVLPVRPYGAWSLPHAPGLVGSLRSTDFCDEWIVAGKLGSLVVVLGGWPFNAIKDERGYKEVVGRVDGLSINDSWPAHAVKPVRLTLGPKA